jgi:hypothetical protein
MIKPDRGLREVIQVWRFHLWISVAAETTSEVVNRDEEDVCVRGGMGIGSDTARASEREDDAAKAW